MDLLVRKHVGCHTINRAHRKHRAKIKCNHQKHRTKIKRNHRKHRAKIKRNHQKHCANFKHKRKRRRLRELGVCILLRSHSRAASSATSRATNQDHPISEEKRASGLDLSSRANSTADNAANNVCHEFGVCILSRSNSRAATSAISRATNQDHPISEEERALGPDLSSRADSMADDTANNMATNNKNQPGFNNDPDPNDFQWKTQQQVLKMQQLEITRHNSLLMEQQLEITHNNSVLMKQRSEISSNSNGKSPDGGKGWVADCLTKRLEAEKLAKAQMIVCEGKGLDQATKRKSKDKRRNCGKLGHWDAECKEPKSDGASEQRERFVHDCGFVEPTAAWRINKTEEIKACDSVVCCWCTKCHQGKGACNHDHELADHDTW